jgi:hypothetical protein
MAADGQEQRFCGRGDPQAQADVLLRVLDPAGQQGRAGGQQGGGQAAGQGRGMVVEASGQVIEQRPGEIGQRHGSDGGDGQQRRAHLDRRRTA